MDATVDRRRLLIPGLSGLYETLAPLGHALMRVSLGVILMPHGIGKLFFGDAAHAAVTMAKLGLPGPLAWAYFIGALECFGGAMLALGLLTRVVALAFAIEMAVICFGVLWPHWGWTHRGMEYPLLMGLFALGFAFRGGGRYSLDHLLGREF
jgi:putative oxidoreductase